MSTSLLLLLQLMSFAHLAVSSKINEGQQIPMQGAASACSKFQSYTALGDSYAGGYGSLNTLPICSGDQNPGRDSCTTLSCGKDTGAYSYQFAHKNNIPNFQYLACNGNDSLSVLHTQVETAAFGKPDLVTINVGGDDDSLFYNVVANCVLGHGSGREKCQSAISNANSTIEELRRGKLAELFNGIKKATQGRTVKVVVMSYALFWANIPELPGGICKPGKSFLNVPSLEERTQMNVLATLLNDALKTRAAEAGFAYVDGNAAFEGHRFCDHEPWFQELFKDIYIRSTFHPTFQGQNTFLKALEQELGC
ncbi:hypothetical protein CERZMDRAFT_87690 [Cercospora zeae-maydis SCOH1-5]|uniref:SGNH hydrolase-type esterase domain-containing protein n=1 Tax=Cercospora zeae-maydis SCOH1-5 TaxID=717836 RepID=A0A6A6F7Y9_9PEZI|nr:hypothetical protein CERZMDRAFT_87690 [Cercospora zeae-maydis SCOH1-5]